MREIKHEFMVPRAALRVWGAADPFAALRFAQGASDDVRTFASSLQMPYCGANSGFEACQWLEEPDSVASLAMIALRHSDSAERIRPAGAGLARSHALQRRHGHRVPGAPGRGRERRPVALVAAVLTSLSTRGVCTVPDADIEPYLQHLAVERHLAARTLTLYRAALTQLHARGAGRRRDAARGAAAPPEALAGRPARRSGWRRAASRSCCRHGVACTAGGASAAR